jgi:hypothetical protein
MKSVSLIHHSMRTLQMCFMMVSIMASCSEEPTASLDAQSRIDYYQFDEHLLDLYGIDASIMIPNETAGIGASFESEIIHNDGDFKWQITAGRNFNIFIEDYGDYQYRMPEFIRKLEAQDIFKTQIIEQKEDYVIFKRELNLSSKTISTYHLYGVKYINGVYYEIRNNEKGDSMKVIDFILKSFLSFKSINTQV